MRRSLVILALAVAVTGFSGTPPTPAQVWSSFLTREGGGWAVHRSDRGTIVALYGLSRAGADSAGETVSDFLKRYSLMMGISNPAGLRLERVERSLLGTHFRFRQYYGGLPVASSEVNIHVDHASRLIAASSRFYDLHGSVQEPRNATEAAATASRFLGVGDTVTHPKLFVFPSGGEPRPAWRCEGAARDGRAWILYVDAVDPRVILRAVTTTVQFEGQGSVWTENPSVNATRSQVKFLHMDSSKALSGQYVRVYDANFKRSLLDVAMPSIDLAKFTTASSPNRKYIYPEGDARLSEAMAYYHMNRTHDRWRSLGFRGLDSRAPVFVNIAMTQDGPGWDNAQYSRAPQFPKTGKYLFGAGQVFHNFGLDGDVYAHEYGHGVLDHAVPALLEAVESVYPQSFHEAFGDISACALSGNSRMGEFASINNKTGKWEGRNLDNKNRYPVHVSDPEKHMAEPHHTGLIAGGSWWDLQKEIGIPRAQALLYQSLGLLPGEMSFFDLRDAMAAADATLNGETNHAAILAAFAKHGIKGADSGQKGRIQFKGLLVTGGPPSRDEQIKSTFQRGDIIYLVAQYDGAGLSPGYNLVPERFSFGQPPGGDAFAYPLIAEVGNGPHRGLKGLHLYEVDTESTTAPGVYTFVLSARLGGTNRTFPQATISFTLN